MPNLFLSLDYPCSELHIEEGGNESGSIEALRNDLRRVDMDQTALLWIPSYVYLGFGVYTIDR